RGKEEFEVIGHGWFRGDGSGEIGGPIQTIGPAGIASLQAALVSMAEFYGDDVPWEVPVWVTETSPQDFDEDYSPREPVSFLVEKELFRVVVDAFLTDPSLGDESDLSRVVAPLLTRHRCALREIALEGSGTQTWWSLRFVPPVRGQTVAG